MTTQLRIDFISDIACPWCVIGLRNMEAALAEVGDEIAASIRFEPFELNPDMAEGGMDRAAYFAEKYRLPADEAKRRGGAIREAAEATGFAMNTGEGFRIYNTFDCHRLLHWALGEGRQRALKHALFEAYFTDNRDISDADVLAEVAAGVGLDEGRAREILAGDEFADVVRTEEQEARRNGVQSVPTIIVAGEYVINGAQPPEIFMRAFRHIAGEVAKKAVAANA